MRRYILTSVVLVPLLFTFSHAAQDSAVNGPAQAWGFSSDEGGSHSYLGVDIADVTSERLSALKLKEERGVEVTMVDQDAPAGKRGVIGVYHSAIPIMLPNWFWEKLAAERKMITTAPIHFTFALAVLTFIGWWILRFFYRERMDG